MDIGQLGRWITTVAFPWAKQTGSQDNPPPPVKLQQPHNHEEKQSDFSRLHAHRAQSPLVREDWHNGSHDPSLGYWKPYKLKNHALGEFFGMLRKEGTYEVLSFLSLTDLCSVIPTLSSAFHTISRRLMADKSYLSMSAIAGFPDKKRFQCWCVIRNSTRSMQKLEERYWDLLSVCIERKADSKAIQTILRDVHRTFPEDPFFAATKSVGHQMLQELLSVYSFQDSEVGYTQGMNYLAGFMLMNSNGRLEKCFGLMVCMMYEYDQRWMFLPGLPHLTMFLWEFNHFMDMYLRKLHLHMQSHRLDPNMYVVEWFITLFTYVLPKETVKRVWDLYFLESWKTVFMIGLALLKRSQNVLLTLDFEGMLRYLKQFPDPQVTEADGLIRTGLSFRITDFLLDELEEVYMRDVILSHDT